MTLERIYFRAAYATALALLLGLGALAAYSSYEAWRLGWEASDTFTSMLHENRTCASVEDAAAKGECSSHVEFMRGVVDDADRYWRAALYSRRQHVLMALTLPVIPLILFYIGRWAATNRVRPLIPR